MIILSSQYSGNYIMQMLQLPHSMKFTYRIIFLIYQPAISLYYIGFWLYHFVIELNNLIIRWINPVNNKNQTVKTFFPKDIREKLGLHFSELFRNTENNKERTTSLVWIHAVSGGEVKLAEKIIRLFYFSKVYSGKILITYCSHTGYEFTKKLFATNPHILTSYLPIDCWWNMRAMIHHIRRNYRLEKMFVIEHDLWPNLLTTLKKHHVESVVVNYFLKPIDYKLFRLFPPAFHFVHQVDVIVVQSEAELRKLAFFHKDNFSTTKILNGGNLKYGPFVLPNRKNNTTTKNLGRKSVTSTTPLTICLGSSHSGEDELLLNALLPHFKNGACKRSILIPRHPERAQSLYKTIIKYFTVNDVNKQTVLSKENIFCLDELCQANPKLSSKEVLVKHLTKNIPKNKKPSPEVIIVDTLGLSETAYSLSDIVLIGDSFLPSNGGHNFLEAMAYAVPVVYGPHLVSYGDITTRLEEAEAVIRVAEVKNKENTSTSLPEVLTKLVTDDFYRKKVGENALNTLPTISFDKGCYQKVFSINTDK